MFCKFSKACQALRSPISRLGESFDVDRDEVYNLDGGW